MVLDKRTIKREGIKRRKIFVKQTCQQSPEKREGSSFPVCWMMKSPKKAKNFCYWVLGCGVQDPPGVLRFQGGMPGPGRDQRVLPVLNCLDTPKTIVCKLCCYETCTYPEQHCSTSKALAFPSPSFLRAVFSLTVPFKLGAPGWLGGGGAEGVAV